MNGPMSLLLRLVALAFTLSFSLPLPLPLSLAFTFPFALSLAFAVALALIVLRRGADNRRRRHGEQQRTAAEDSLQESSSGRGDLIEELLFAHVGHPPFVRTAEMVTPFRAAAIPAAIKTHESCQRDVRRRPCECREPSVSARVELRDFDCCRERLPRDRHQLMQRAARQSGCIVPA